MTDVSIVIPIFNSEKWLRKCIDSVLNQTWGNLELILVNDGSTDGSEGICQLYAECDARVKILNQSNQGQSSARNLGLDVASGEYVYFLDSDDHIADNLVELCMTKIRDEKYDVLTFDTVSEIDGEDLGRYSRTLLENTLLQCSDVLRVNIKNEEFCPTVWMYMYKRSFLLNHGIRFSEGIIYEDNVFTYNVLSRRATCFYLPYKLHFHLVHSESSIGRRPNFYNVQSLVTVLDEMIDIHTALGRPIDHYKLLRMYAWLPLRVSLEEGIFNRVALRKYFKIIIGNPNLLSLSVIKSILKFILRLGRKTNRRL